METEKQRTLKQNKSLHKFCELLADELNAAGLDMKTVLKPSVDISWSKQSVKEFLWRPIQEAMLQKESTTDLNSAEPSEIHAVLMRHLSEKFGVYVSWPSRFGD